MAQPTQLETSKLSPIRWENQSDTMVSSFACWTFTDVADDDKGYSYGTLLGSTVAALFGTGVDKMALDGNMNPQKYYTEL